MSQITIHRADDESKKSSPLFAEIARRFDAIKQRAFDLFERRGSRPGHDLEDWLAAEHQLLASPASELSENDGVYQMRVALPGFTPQEIEVTATPSEIVMHAFHKNGKTTEENHVLWTEFGATDVYRSFVVTNPINVDKVTASIDNGLLRINAPEIAKPKEAVASA